MAGQTYLYFVSSGENGASSRFDCSRHLVEHPHCSVGALTCLPQMRQVLHTGQPVELCHASKQVMACTL